MNRSSSLLFVCLKDANIRALFHTMFTNLSALLSQQKLYPVVFILNMTFSRSVLHNHHLLHLYNLLCVSRSRVASHCSV